MGDAKRDIEVIARNNRSPFPERQKRRLGGSPKCTLFEDRQTNLTSIFYGETTTPLLFDGHKKVVQF